MGKIMMKTDAAREIKSAMYSLNKQQYDISKKMNTYLDTVMSSWSGEVPSAFAERLANRRKNETSITDLMNKYCEALEFAVNELQRADDELAAEQRRKDEEARRTAAAAAAGAGVGAGIGAGVGNASGSNYYPVPGHAGARNVNAEYMRSTIGFDYTVKKYKDLNGNIVYGKIHAGYDIVGSLGEKIIAPPINGKVIQNKNNAAGYGNYILVEYEVNGKYYYVVYAHLNKAPTYGIGTTIPAGTPFAEMGKSGAGANNSVHLHIDVRCNDDPTKKLDAATFVGSNMHYVNPNEFYNAIGTSL